MARLRRMCTQRWRLLLTLVLLTLVGCGGDQSEVQTVPQAKPDVVVIAAQGGRLQSDDGQVLAVIPANALAADSTVSLAKFDGSAFKDADLLLTAGYQFGPTSLTVTGSIELVFNWQASTTPLPALYQLLNGRWHRLQSSAFAAGQTDKLSVTISEAGSYALGQPQLSADIVQRQKGPQCQLGSGPQQVAITHIADLHARYHVSQFDKNSDQQRYAKLRALADARHAQYPYHLFTDGGDDYEKGSLAEELSQGKSTRLATYAMGFDLRVLGNHDFAWGESEMLAFSDDPTALTLASNTRYFGANPDDFHAIPYAEYDLGCVRIGVIGLVGESWDEFDSEQAVDHLPNFKTDMALVSRAQQLIDQYRGRVDYLVMLNHLRFDQDVSLAQQLSGVDLILGGHAHRGYKLWQNGSMIFEEELVDELVLQINQLAAQLALATEGEKFFLQQQIDSLQAQVDVLLPQLTAEHRFTSGLNKPFVVQPGYYGRAAATLLLTFTDQARPTLSELKLQIVETDPLTAEDETVKQTLTELVTQYVPHNDQVLAVTETGYQTGCVGLNSLCDPQNTTQPIAEQRQQATAKLSNHIVQLLAKAALATQSTDAVLLDPNVTNLFNRMLREQTSVTLQDFYRSYIVERQPADSPGYNALYFVLVSGAQLQKMRERQPFWLYLGPTQPTDSSLYKVILHKAAALNLADDRVFGSDFGTPVQPATLIAESWQVLKQYALSLDCQYLDSNAPLPDCQSLNQLSIWSFADASNPLAASQGSGTLSYADPNNSNWFATALQNGDLAFAHASDFAIAPLPGGDKTIMKFTGFAKDQGLLLRHNASANGYFKSLNKLSDYTLVLDLYLPEASLPPQNLNGFTLLQSNIANTDTADIRLDDSQNQDDSYKTVVVFSDYLGYKQIAFAAGQWHRLAITMHAAANNLSAKVYVDGVRQVDYESGQCYQKDPVNNQDLAVECYRFALDAKALLFASSSSSRNNAAGYIGNLLFTGRVLSDREIASLGAANALMPVPKFSLSKLD